MGEHGDGAARRKFRSAARRATRAVGPGLPPVLFLTDPARTPDPAAIAARLPQGWGVVYRHFGAEDRAKTAARLREITLRRRQVLLISADPALARTIGADGVHWPERCVRRLRGRDLAFSFVTASAHGRAAIARAAARGIDAVLMSAVFPSASPSAGDAIGPARLRALAARASIPVYALGGVTADTAGRVAGAAGLAAIGGLDAAFGD